MFESLLYAVIFLWFEFLYIFLLASFCKYLSERFML